MADGNLEASLQQLAALRAQFEELQAQVATARMDKLQGLHEELGFGSTQELIAALRVVVKTSEREANTIRINGHDEPLTLQIQEGRPAKKKRRRRAKEAPPAASDARKSKFAPVPPEMRAKILADLKAATEPGTAIAKRYGISNFTIHQIKAAAGLVKKKKRRAGK